MNELAVTGRLEIFEVLLMQLSLTSVAAAMLNCRLLRRVTGVGSAQEKSTRIAGVIQVATFAFGAPLDASAQSSSTSANASASAGTAAPALYLVGLIERGDDVMDGIWVSHNVGRSWLPFRDAAQNVTVGKAPVAIDASMDVFGKVVIGTNGRGIWFNS